MNAPETLSATQDWTDVNQRALVAEFGRLKGLFEAGRTDRQPTPVGAAPGSAGAPSSMDMLVGRFGLSSFERDLLLLAAGVEMDAEIAALCAAAHGAPQRTWASFGLALALLAEPHWSALTPLRPLRRWQFVEVDDTAGLTQGRLRIDERVLHYLAGINHLDRRLQPLLKRVPEPDLMADAQRATAADIAGLVQCSDAPLPIVQLSGGDRHGKWDIASAAAALCGAGLYVIAAADIPDSPLEADVLATLWARETAMQDVALLVECADTASAAVTKFLDRVGGLAFLSIPEPAVLNCGDLRYRVDKPNRQDQRRLWELAVGGKGKPIGVVLDDLVAEFRFSARDIGRLARQAQGHPDLGLWQACREQERRRLDGLAQRIEPAATWDDIVLPPLQTATLRQIASHVRQRTTVFERWGFATKSARGQGLSVLFAGESGTGKTMAAEVLADELRLDLFRIDLSAVVSKYIGETEKNLGRVFDAAEDSGAILLFDEADALFGKRSEVKDSHDRYANIEVSYLLQRMEAYRGLAILTTNQKAALDTAFHRRLRFVVNFPFPEVGEREAIWRRIFPDATPTESLDPAKLARLQMAGGSIRSIALNGAFHAAEDGQPVNMGHLLRAAHAEAAKRDRPLADAEIRSWL